MSDAQLVPCAVASLHEDASGALTDTPITYNSTIRLVEPFPQVILEEILDILHIERREAFFREQTNPHRLYKHNGVQRGLVMANMSLVQRSWAGPCQRALGRLLCLDVTDICRRRKADLPTSIFGVRTLGMSLRLYQWVFTKDFTHTVLSEL